MRLTKRKALEITRDLWQWLAEDGTRNKEDWPGWDIYGPMWVNCALCEYNSRHNKNWDSCTSCPLFKKWGECKLCLDDGSPFDHWSAAKYEGDEEGAEQAAAVIVEICKQALKGR